MEKTLQAVANLLGYKTTNPLEPLIEAFPEQEAWEYALERLPQANHPNLKYLAKCLRSYAEDTGLLPFRKGEDEQRAPRGKGDKDHFTVKCPHCSREHVYAAYQGPCSLIVCPYCKEGHDGHGNPYPTVDVQRTRGGAPRELGDILKNIGG